jgi:glutamate-1-semialdehyde 2,1-aminomutase
MSHGRGAYLFDTDGRKFLDLNASFTTLIHGHTFAPVVAALDQQLRDGTCFANSTEKERLLCANPRHHHIRRVCEPLQCRI